MTREIAPTPSFIKLHLVARLKPPTYRTEPSNEKRAVQAGCHFPLPHYINPTHPQLFSERPPRATEKERTDKGCFACSTCPKHHPSMHVTPPFPSPPAGPLSQRVGQVRLAQGACWGESEDVTSDCAEGRWGVTLRGALRGMREGQDRGIAGFECVRRSEVRFWA